jgi:hypothetical protein
MSTAQVESHLSVDELLKGVEQLSQPELEKFVAQVIALQARRCAPSLPQTEAELLQKINQGLPLEVRKRYDELTAKRQSEMLTPDDGEYEELLRLTDEVETLDAQRLEYLVKLADLRGTTLSNLMKDLGIGTPSYE